MASKDYINGVTDAVKVILNANQSTLLNFATILERDQEPSVIADSAEMLPIIVVSPVMRTDSINLTCGDDDLRHSFSVSITGYYNFNDIGDDIRAMRGVAYDCLDLFRAVKQIGSAHIRSANVNPGYFVMVDKPIYKWVVSLNCVMYEPEG